MPVRRLLLGFPKSPNIVVRPCAFGALSVFTIDLVEAALVKGVLAQEMHRRQVQTSTARGTASSLEDGRFGAQVFHFFSLGLGLGTVALD